MKKFVVVALACALQATSVMADCPTTIVYQTMGPDGFELTGEFSIQENGLVCSAQFTMLQDYINDMQQHPGWFGTQWTDVDGTRHRLLRPEMSRWSRSMGGFFGGNGPPIHLGPGGLSV